MTSPSIDNAAAKSSVYAHRPRILDADTHMMEPVDWIASFADPEIRPRLAPFARGDLAVQHIVDDAARRLAARRSDPAERARVEAEFMTMTYKGWHGLGAWDGAERARANDLLGFDAHLVFPTEAFNQVIAAKDAEVLVGGIEALNRGLASFCAADRRMMGAAYVRLGLGPARALSMLDDVIAQGYRVILIDTIPPAGGLSFTHPEYDRVWARIVEAGLAVTLHIGAEGGAYKPVPDAFFNNGRPRPGHGSGDAPTNALAYMGMPFNAQIFLAALVFDGVLERFPGLRIGVVELGATWMVSFLKHLDQSHRAFRRAQDLSHLTLKPSEYLQRQVKITPFAGEDIGWIMTSGAGDMLMFASDYPHHEGTDDPIARFERTMTDLTETARHQFYTGNFEQFIGAQRWWN